MKNRITTLFGKKNSNILSVYYTAGFPTLDSTVPIARILEEAGADLMEIGIPFSDPVADGPTIQESNKIALDNGMHLHLLVRQVQEIRSKKVSIPVILMGYLNPVMQYGIEQFVQDASRAGVDGLIVPDMPVYEYEENYRSLFEAHNLCNTFLVSPTTSEERIRSIDAATNGFIYAVSASSTTGAKEGFRDEQIAYFTRLQKMKLKNPCLIGFGISSHQTFSKASEYSAGAIVGSAFINLLKKSSDVEKDIHAFVRELKGTPRKGEINSSLKH
jgi:tryptophan synthase alpha chain